MMKYEDIIIDEATAFNYTEISHQKENKYSRSLLYIFQNPKRRKAFIKKHFLNFEAGCVILIAITLIPVLFILAIVFGVQPIYSGSSGVISCIYQIKGKEEIIKYGRYNPKNGHLREISDVTEVKELTTLRVSAITRNGTIYWSSGNHKYYAIDTNTGISREYTLSNTQYKIASLVSNQNTSSIFAIVNTGQTKELQRLVRSKDDNDEYSTSPDGFIVRLHEDSTTICAINPETHQVATIYVDRFGDQTQELLIINLKTKQKEEYHLENFAVTSLTFQKEFNKLLAIARDLDEQSEYVVTLELPNDGQKTVLVEKIIQLPLPPSEPIIMSSFYKYDQQRVVLMTKTRIMQIDLEKYEVIADNSIPYFVKLSALQPSPNIYY